MCDAGILRLTFFSKRAYPPLLSGVTPPRPGVSQWGTKHSIGPSSITWRDGGPVCNSCNIYLAFIDNGLGVLKSTKFYILVLISLYLLSIVEFVFVFVWSKNDFKKLQILQYYSYVSYFRSHHTIVSNRKAVTILLKFESGYCIIYWENLKRIFFY